MVAYVMRELRRQKVVSDRKKRRNAAAEETPPIVTVREVADLFPTLSEGVIRSRLKDRCSCVVYKVVHKTTLPSNHALLFSKHASDLPEPDPLHLALVKCTCSKSWPIFHLHQAMQRQARS